MRRRRRQIWLLRLLISFLVLSAALPVLRLDPAAARAQDAPPPGSSSGVIAGVVLDQEDQQPLPNARVGLYRILPGDSVWTLVAGGLTDAEGRYRFQVPAGTYRAIFNYQSYSVTIRDDVALNPDSTIQLTATLTPKPLQIQGVDVKGIRATGSEEGNLVEQREADFVSDGVSSEQMSRSTESNAAEALQRVTGLSVVQGRYVYVRGLGERYSSTQVNGASVGTPEPNKRVVPLDLFPTAALDEIVVQKTYTPDQEGEFAGGVIQIHTRATGMGSTSAPKFTQSVATGYSIVTGTSSRLDYDGGKFDGLGFDDGTRGYPDEFEALAGDQRVAQKGLFGGEGFSAAEIQSMGRSFNKTYSPREEGDRLNYSYAGTYSKGLTLFGADAGFLGSLSLSNSSVTQARDNNAYSGTATSLTPLYTYKVDESTMKFLGGGLMNFSVSPAPDQTVSLRTLYTRSADDNVRVMEGPNYNYGTDKVRIASLDYVERGLLSAVLGGSNQINRLGGWKLDWRGSYSETMRDEPDRRENVYESDGLGGLALSTRQNYPITRIWGDMNEYDRSAGLDVFKIVPTPGERELRLKGGASIRQRNRTSSFRRLGFYLGSSGRNSLDRHLSPESLLVDENIKPGYFELQEATRENDTYNAKQELHAYYAMATVDVVPKLELLGGARVESSDQAVESKSPFVTGAEPVDAHLEDTDVLPAANLTYRISEVMNARFGYSETVARPELRELSPFDMYDYETGYSETGNPDIQSTTIENLDARWELYPGTRELLSVSGFKKTLAQPIENVVEGSSGGYV
ncbi:MAG TPA: TonB-dependent receptor, partial [Vicinamibacteria bacterium]|nr:TonB-dependent receptor [Vicinamibacteria bacterium]